MQSHPASSTLLCPGSESTGTSPARRPLPSPSSPSPTGSAAGRGSFAIPDKQTPVLLRLEKVQGK
jgi:hypothetical protein